MSHFVIAIPATLTMQQKLDHFLESALVQQGENSAALYIQCVEEVTDRAVSLFLLEPSQIAQFSSMMMKIVNFAASISSKTSNTLTAQIYKKASRDQMHNVAEFWKRIIWWAPHNNVHSYITVPVTAEFAANFRELAEHCRNGQAKANSALAQQLCNYFADTIIDDLFLAPTDYVDLGMVMRKLLSVGVDGVKKAIHEMIGKIMRDVTEAQMSEFVFHYEKMVAQRTE